MHTPHNIDLIPLSTLQAYLAQCNDHYIDYYLNDTVDTLLEAFDHLTITFNRRMKGLIQCEAMTYWGEAFTATGDVHILAGCRAIYKALTLQEGQMKLDYYQRYL